ncbi:MAG TPA: dihydrofolate reductase [Lacunisphaera sp.]|jgi:dihydrofolate reductase|nr:dihydrofolate reductase [Lacunisphaera sp.]
MAKPINLIVACTENRVIGRDGRLPFDIPEDKAWFHERTAHAVVVMGRICFESWPRVLADGRRPVVISSQPERVRRVARLKADPALRLGSNPAAMQAPATSVEVPVAADVPAALALAQALPGEIMVCGGQQVYEETLPLCDRLLLTLVHADEPGDTWFPEWRHLAWRETWRREGRDANYRYTFLILDRGASAAGR